MRKKTPASTEADLLIASRRRCAICWGLLNDLNVKRGQIAHLDRDHANASVENLAFLCLDHHDEYDTRRSQSKGFTVEEVKRYRDDLYRLLSEQQEELSFPLALTPSESALKLIELLCRDSKAGHKFDPQLLLSDLPSMLGLDEAETEEVVDEVVDMGIAELNGTHDFIFPLDRLFWTFDPLFLDHDPASDAVVIARRLTELGKRVRSEQILVELSWDARRLNPAINFLVDNELIRGRLWSDSAPFMYGDVEPTVKTRRFLKTVRD